MRSILTLLFYVDYKCDTQPGFRKTFLVFTLIFVFLLWSPWRPLLCPVFGVCPAPIVRADTAPQPKPQGARVKHSKRPASTLAPVQIPAEPSVVVREGTAGNSEVTPDAPRIFSVRRITRSSVGVL